MTYRPRGTKGVRRGRSAPPGGPTTPPLDPTFEADLATANRNRAVAGAEATYQTGQINQEYGITDHSNPYSRAALLEEQYKRSKAGTVNSYASAGQLNSGAYQRMQGENDRNYSIGSDQLARQYQNSIHNVQYGQAQTIANSGSGVDDAAFQALLRAIRG